MTDRETVSEYHDATKHHFNRFARSMGYLDWASQPRPFRSFDGSAAFPFGAPSDVGTSPSRPSARYDQLFDGTAASVALTMGAVGALLRYSLGLSAWKAFGESRWALRVNPSSGNLHPTEAYVVCPSLEGLAGAPAVYHYAPERHALELRCALDERGWVEDHAPGTVLVMLTSIHWRESWKYGERAFRYCQHDLGHAVAAISLSAALLGWRARLLPTWSHDAIAAVTGLDRADDFLDAELEDPGCAIAIAPSDPPERLEDPGPLVAAARGGRWSGRASCLSRDHVPWPLIDAVARATADPGRAHPLPVAHPDRPAPMAHAGLDARALLLQRRSALSFDGRSPIGREAFLGMLARVTAFTGAPFDAVWWTPRIHLALFVHRVDGLAPGLYLLARDEASVGGMRGAFRPDFDWQRVDTGQARLPLFLLMRGDCRSPARRLSCDQNIAADGFFSLGMIARFDDSLEEFGSSFYRHLFWESGIVGQVLYLEAEAAGARGTGIGCFYDDPVHDVLGVRGHAFQSLYHFTVGHPVSDERLTTAPGYDWEARPADEAAGAVGGERAI